EGCHLTVTGSAETLADHNDDSVLAIAESGSGRVVAVGAAAPFFQYRPAKADWQVNPNDFFQFTLNVIDWLAGNDQRVAEAPEKMIIRLSTDSELTPTEIEEYELFTGVYHDHTTASDGADTPNDMAIKSAEIGLDWFIVTDHSYDTMASNGIYGGIAVDAFGEANNLATQFIVGAELSAHPHSVGFPLTEQIISNDVQYSVDQIHAQGAYAVFCHPTIGYTYVPVWEDFESIGYDAFEVVSDPYFSCMGEQAYFWNFLGGNDGHSAVDLGKVSNTVFVKDPTGPNGTVSVWDIIEAVENRRIVITSKYNDLIFGQDIWVDRYLEVWEDAEAAIEDGEAQIAISEGEGNNVDLANRFIAEAYNAMNWWNPSNALQAATDAVSEIVLGINIELTTEDLGIIDPNGAVSYTMQLENNLDHGVCVNVTPILATSLTLAESTQLLVVGPESTEEVIWSGTAAEKGYNHIMFYVRNLNTTPVAIPLIFHYGGIINNVSHTLEPVGTGYNVTVQLYENSGDGIYTSSIVMIYDDGTNQETVALTDVGDGYSISIGPFAQGINVTYQITMDDIFGNTFVFEEVVVPVSGGLVIDPLLLVIAGLIGIVAVVAIVVVKRKS
ncbi:MAG: PHP domain-containing protein, partial [Candidatus Thorarchaeota archaeon]